MRNYMEAESSTGSYHLLDENENKITSSNDDSRLKELGYKQELYRGLSFISNFSLTFSIVSVLTGVSTLYNQALTFGGPVTIVCGWPIIGLMTLIVGLSMAEICSAYPTAAGLYYWSAKLAGNKIGPFAAWITGWYGPISFSSLIDVHFTFSIFIFFSNKFEKIGRYGGRGRVEG
ncbi:hypothetical protein MTR67_021668 [Solanum verrucosum]|uniref:Uncharacterized protein n=1 Tax=Solanum verrucosum TaxID=315347 RepID=A0AAF0TX24_SOLVR|nr:hypothetical protein MTR67_021668 [Solanum verrucosum]